MARQKKQSEIAEDDENSSNSSKENQKSEGNTRPQISPAKHWCFTHNNYTEEDIKEWKDIFRQGKLDALVFQTEVGELGTPHLQGCLSFKTKGRPKGLHSSKKPSFRKKKGTVIEMRRYCYKTETYDGKERVCLGWTPPEPIRTIDPILGWQKDILKIVEGPADDRTIIWAWGEGGIGKTSFAKYLSVHHGAVPCSGKGSDMRAGICDYIEKNGTGPRVVVVPIPKSFSCEYLSYEGLETIKDGYFYSSKYKGGVCIYNPPHLVVLSNEEPDVERLSPDRWKIMEITEGPPSA